MPRKKSDSVNVRVSFSGEAWQRMERLAASMSVMPTELVRMMASLQLVQWEAMTSGRYAEAQRNGKAAEVLQEEMEREVEHLVKSKPEEAKPVERPPVGFRTKAEEEHEFLSTHGSQWTGYLKGL